jgi:hypothetical protein
MDYKTLKKLLKRTPQNENKSFFFALDRELEKVLSCFSLQKYWSRTDFFSASPLQTWPDSYLCMYRVVRWWLSPIFCWRLDSQVTAFYTRKVAELQDRLSRLTKRSASSLGCVHANIPTQPAIQVHQYYMG